MTTVILAEKPNQAQAYAEAFQKSKKENGYFKVEDSLFKDETFITFGFGHLVQLATPGEHNPKWEKWNLNSLPIFPDKYKFTVSKDKKKQFKIVAELLKKADQIIIATDSDREGENIAWSIIMQAEAYDKKKNYKRLWINSLEKEAIREGFSNLKNGEDFIPFYKEAQTRQISDWLIGMNGSPLYTLTLHKRGIDGVFSLGRVQTPTLYMIYKRQCEIEDFRKQPYYELESQIETEAGTGKFKGQLTPAQRWLDKEDIASFMIDNSVKEGINEGYIISVDKNQEKTSSPKLFSLSSLQSKGNAQYKASANDILNAVQALYEAKLLTYPRTDTPFITENEFSYLKENINQYLDFLEIPHDQATQLQSRKKYVNNAKVQEHHAIILTKRTITKEEFNNLPDLQQKVYMLIAKTTIAMFLDDYRFEETIIKTKTGDLIFQTKGQIPINFGWKSLFKEEKDGQEDQDNELVNVNVHEKVEVDITIAAKETKPPKAYTEGTLITAMKTAGKTVDDDEAQKMLNEIEGIGTEATRANIIETLKQKEYIKIEKNKLIVTEKGKILCVAVSSEPLLTSAEMTAKWESYLKKIGRNEGSQDKFLSNIKAFVTALIQKVPGAIENMNTDEYKKQKAQEEEKNTVGVCPRCGGDIKFKKSFYGCSNYPDCKFTIPNNFRNKKLTKTNIKNLIDGKSTVVKGIKNKEKKTYNAEVKLNDKGYIELITFVK